MKYVLLTIACLTLLVSTSFGQRNYQRYHTTYYHARTSYSGGDKSNDALFYTGLGLTLGGLATSTLSGYYYNENPHSRQMRKGTGIVITVGFGMSLSGAICMITAQARKHRCRTTNW